MAALFALRALLFLSPAALATYPPVGACSGWCNENLRDPNVVVAADGTYYRFTTNLGLSISTAPSIAGPWTRKGSVLPHGSSITLPYEPVNQSSASSNDAYHKTPPGLWAPDCLLVNGTYYLTYAITHGRTNNSEFGVATSTTMEAGSWVDHGSLGVPASPDYNRIDSNMYQASPDSQPLLSFGSYWENIFQIPLALPPLTVDGSVVHLAENKTLLPQHVGRAVEGSYQFQWTVAGTTWHYLFFSSGDCCRQPPHLLPAGDEYKIMVCRSSKPDGDFVDSTGRSCLDDGGDMILGSNGDVYAPGGEGVLYDPTLKSPVIYYHYLNTTVGYKNPQVFFGWNYLDFDSGWPVVVADAPTAAAGNGSATKHSMATATWKAPERGLLGLVLGVLVWLCWS